MRDDHISRKAAIDALKIAELGCEVEAIEALPSAEPEIIRCKDCYHYPGEYSDCPMIGWFRHEDDYCSRAERRTDE